MCIRDSYGFSPITGSEHKAIYDAAIARDADACIAAIVAHLELYEDNNRAPDRRLPTGENT